MHPAPWTEPDRAARVRSVALFCGPSLRAPVDDGRADFVPVFLSDIPSLFTNGVIPLDVAMVQLSPPGAHGYCSLGTSVDCARAAVDSARFVIAEINEQMPRTLGNTAIPFERLDAVCVTDRPLPEHRPGKESAKDLGIHTEMFSESTPVSAGRWTSFVAPRARGGASRLSPCRPPRARGRCRVLRRS